MSWTDDSRKPCEKFAIFFGAQTSAHAYDHTICRSFSDGVPNLIVEFRSKYFSGLPSQHRCK